MSKAFDWVNGDLLLLRLLQYGVDGKFYRTIKTLYRNNVSCVKIINCNTEWFEYHQVSEKLTGKTACRPTLFYADDIVLFAENEEDLQRLIEHVHKWCNKW